MATGMMMIPEELDVFKVPHLRMKQLVNSYRSWVDDVTLMSADDFAYMLQSLRAIFIEFKSHEHIENKLIIARLLEKMKEEADYQSSFICNCHKDNSVSEMMRLFADGVRARTAEERTSYALMLSRELHKFTDSFLPHMKEEEEVFQPLLLQYFSYDELRRLKDEVIQHHSLDKTTLPVTLYTGTDNTEKISKTIFSSDQQSEIAVQRTLNKTTGRNITRPHLSCGISENVVVEHPHHVDNPSCSLCTNPCGSECLDPLPSDGLGNEFCQLLTIASNESCSKSQMNSVQCSNDASSNVDKTATVAASHCCESTGDVKPESSATTVKAVRYRGKNPKLCSSSKSNSSDLFRNRKMMTYRRKRSEYEIQEENLQLAQSRTGISVEELPAELLLGIFRWLAVDDICRCAQVCSSWSTLSRDGSLWIDCLPTQWSKGCWKSYECDDIHEDFTRTKRTFVDIEEIHNQKAQQERKLVDLANSLTVHILPAVGERVQKLVLDNSSIITDSMVQAFLSLCPNLLHLDLAVTDISDLAFSRWITEDVVSTPDSRPVRRCHRLEYLNVAGCDVLTDAAIRFLCPDGATTNFSSVNMSGCFGITSEGLWRLARSSPLLKPTKLYYCDNIVDGPFANDANGCANLEQSTDSRHVCCRTGQ